MSVEPLPHLRVRTHYSILDGMLSPRELIEMLVGQRQQVVGVCDRYSVAAWPKIDRLARENGMRAIFGMEIDVPASHGTRVPVALLATTDRGLQTLIRLSSETTQMGWIGDWDAHGQLPGGQPVPWETVSLLEGVVALTDGLTASASRGAEIANEPALRRAQGVLRRLSDCLGAENVYAEAKLSGRPGEERYHRLLAASAAQLGLRTVVTDDARYERAEQQSDYRLVRRAGRAYHGRHFPAWAGAHHLRSSAELQAGSQAAWRREAQALAERCQGKLRSQLLAPQIDGEAEHQLRQAWEEGLRQRYQGQAYDRALPRAEQEWDALRRDGQLGLVAVVTRVCQQTRAAGQLLGPGRGLMSSSVLLYALGLTEIDPLVSGLPSLPAFDHDNGPRQLMFDVVPSLRPQMMQRLRRELPGAVCQARVRRPMRANQALAAAALAWSPGSDRREWADAMRRRSSYDADDRQQLQQMAAQHPQAADVVRLATWLLDRPFKEAVHAGALLLAGEQLEGSVPLRVARGGRVCDFDHEDVKQMGMSEVIILALSALGLIEQTNDALQQPYEHLWQLPEDPAVFAELADSRALALWRELIWSFRDGTDWLRQVRPQTLMDLAVVMQGHGASSLMRDYTNPVRRQLPRKLADILAPTRGCLVFEEQALVALMAYGIDISAARLLLDDLRSACLGSKKRLADALAQAAPEVSESEHTEVARLLIAHAASPVMYGASALAYARIAYTLAYLAVYHPVALATATIDQPSAPSDRERLLEAWGYLDVMILPVDINHSASTALAGDGSVRLGLSTLSGVSREDADRIVAERLRGGPYRDFQQLRRRATITRGQQALRELFAAD